MMEAKDIWAIATLQERPPRNGSRRDEDAFWHQERKAKAFLLETLTDELIVSVGTKRYAYEVLEYLEQTYEAKNWGNLVALREKFISLKYEDGQEMTAHLNKLKTLAKKLARQGKSVDDKERVCQLLTSLPESWAHFKSVYFTQDRPLAGSTMERNVMAEYSRRSHAQPSPVTERETAVPAVTNTDVYMMGEALIAARRNQPHARRPHSHRPAPYPQRAGSGQACFYCGKEGHHKQVCRLRLRHLQERGAPEEQGSADSHTAVANGPATGAYNAAEVVEQLPPVLDGEVWGLAASVQALKVDTSSASIEWVIDSGCTQHMTSDRSIFEKLDVVAGRQVRVTTAKLTPVEGVGTVLLNVRMNDGQSARIRLHDVLFVPKLEMNLLVYQASQAGAKFDFHTTPGAVTMTLGFLQVTCQTTNKLYMLHAARSTPAALAVRPDLTLDLLHHRFGHASKQILRKMASSKMATGMDFLPDQENIPCDACELGTKRRATFKMGPRVDLDSCDNVVYSDIAGPVEYPTIKLERYVLLFVDGYSRYCTVRLLQKRSEMFQGFLDYKARSTTDRFATSKVTMA